MAKVVVHRGSPEAVIGVAHQLQEAGLQAEVIDRPNFVVLLVAFGTYKSRVVVPEEEAQAAREFLERWDQEASERVLSLSQALGRQALWASLCTLLTGACLFLTVEENLGLSLLFFLPGVWIASFILISLLSAAWKRSPPPEA